MISKNLNSLATRIAPSTNKPGKPDASAAKVESPGAGTQNRQAVPTDLESQTTTERLLNTPSPLSRLNENTGQESIPRTENTSTTNANANLSPSLFPSLTLNQVTNRSIPQNTPELSRSNFLLNFAEPDSDAAISALSEPDDTAHLPEASSSDQELADEIVDDVQSDLEVIDEALGDDPFYAVLDPDIQETLSQRAVDATETLERISEIEDPEIREQVLNELNADIERLGEALNYIDTPSARTAIDSLTRTTEALGSEQADLIAQPLAQGLEKSLSPSFNSGQRALIFGESVIEGHGALLATRLPNFVDIESPAFEQLTTAAVFGVGSVNSDFEEALEAKQEVDFLVAQFIFEWGDVLSDTELQDAIDKIWEENTDVVEELEAQSVRLATLLEGAGSLGPNAQLHAAGIGDSELWDQVQKVKANLEPFAYTSFGQDYLAQGIAASANGETNFVSHLASFASVIDSGVGKADTVANLIVRTVAVRGASYIQSGDIDSAIELFEGLEEQWVLIGLNNRQKLEELTVLLEEFKRSDLNSEQFADLFATKARDIKGRAFRDDTSTVGKSFRLLGIGVGTASVINNFRSAEDFQDYLEAGVGTAGLAGEIVGLLPPTSRFSDFLGNFSKLAKLGPVFDTLAVVQALDSGDPAQAGIAFAGLVGGLLVSSSSVGPLGTAVGAFLAVGATIGGFALNAYRKNQAEDNTEELFGKALEAAGFSEEDANLLRDVSGDTRRSVGIIFSQLAAANPDFTARELLDAFLEPGESHGNIPASFAVDENGDLLFDNRKELIDLIEELPRLDNGYFTPESVQEAAVLFEQNLGFSIDPSGLDAETSLDALEEEFETLDLNGDGQVSKDELEKIVEYFDTQSPYFGIPIEPPNDNPYIPRRIAAIARYFVSREDLIDRLDVGSEGGQGNGKISLDDINAVREENQALRVILENRDIFDIANQQDASKADQEISKDDLRAIANGEFQQDHPDFEQLQEAAQYLLDNDRFFDRIDTSDPDDVRTNDDEVTGDGKLMFNELILATLGNHGVTR